MGNAASNPRALRRAQRLRPAHGQSEPTLPSMATPTKASAASASTSIDLQRDVATPVQLASLRGAAKSAQALAATTPSSAAAFDALLTLPRAAASLSPRSNAIMSRFLPSSSSSPKADDALADGSSGLWPRSASPLRNKSLKLSLSTHTVCIDATLHTVARRPLLNCLASWLAREIAAGDAAPITFAVPDYLDERLHPLAGPRGAAPAVPTHAEVLAFLSDLFESLLLGAQPALIVAVYIERLRAAGTPLVAASWRRLVLATVIVATKVWNDQVVWNLDVVDRCSAAGHATTAQLARLERGLLAALDFNVNIRVHVYASAYFTLRAYAQAHDLEFHDPAEAADLVSVAVLERVAQRRHSGALYDGLSHASTVESLERVSPASPGSVMRASHASLVVSAANLAAGAAGAIEHQRLRRSMSMAF